jgi:serine/threonine-protein kinase
MTVLFSLFFTYTGRYTEVRIPDFSVMTLEEALALSNDIFEYDTVYESNPEYDGGDIISQKPSAGVLRKIYKKDGKLKITLTVNKDTEYFTLPPLQGKPIRDALLGLRSMGIKTKIINEYSPTVPVGAIISSSHSSGTRIKKGDTVTLKVSLGKEILQVSVPDLVGKSERDALTLLSANRLDVGAAAYKASNERIGTVISQGTAARSTVREGSKISFCVSAGPYYSSE